MRFYDDNHTYFEADRQYTSVSKVIHELQRPKDWKAIAKKYAKDHSMAIEEVETKWKEKNTKAINRGKKYHAEQQNTKNEAGIITLGNHELIVRFNPVELFPPNEQDPSTERYFIEQPDCKLENNTLYTEYMVWDEETGICGTADEVYVIDDTIYVEDHKTNESIDKEGFYNAKTGREKLRQPVGHLDDCNWSHYCIQTSLYMYMLWKRNKHLKVGKINLNHVIFDEEDNPIRINKMEVPYLRSEVQRIREWWKSRK